MSQELPSVTPRWATNPPASPPVTITEPTETEKDRGWQPGNPRRQHDNWFKNIVGQWVEWLRHLLFRTDDVYGDQALPGGTPPTTGAGLSVSSGSFSAQAYAGGYRVELTSGPNVQSQIFIVPASPNNTTLYRLVINGTNADYTTDGTATQAELRDNMVIAINAAVGAAVTATADGTNIRVVQDVPGVPFTFAIAVGPAAPITLGSSTPSYIYSINSDTYWDLHRSGTWIPVIVASGAGEPAVTTNATRVYRVRTDGADRTLVNDRRRSRVTQTKNIDNTGNIRHTTETISKGIGGVSTGAEMRAPRETDTVDEIAAVYQELRSVEASGGLLGPIHMYSRHDVGLSVGRTIVWGAHLSAASTWTVDIAADVYRLDFLPNGSTVGMRFKRKTGLTPGSTFADNTWDDELLANTTRLQLPLGFGLKLGGDEMGQGSGVNANLTPLIEFVRNVGGADRTLLTGDLTAADATLREYISTELGITRHERVYNATWNDSTKLWARDVAGWSWLEVFGEGAKGVSYHSAGGAATWATTAWTPASLVTEGGTTFYENLNVSSGTTTLSTLDVTTAATATRLKLSELDNSPLANTINAVNTPKAFGTIVIVGGVIQATTLFGCSAAFGGAGGQSVILTMLIPMITPPSPLSAVVTRGLVGLGNHLAADCGATQTEVQFWNSAGTVQSNPTAGGFNFVFNFAIFGPQ